MIKIIVDKHRYGPAPSGAVAAAAPADYVAVRRRIRTALNQNASLTVYATDPVVLSWLSDLQRYPESRIAWQVIDPGEEFTRLFGIGPTEPFTPARIAALQLHTLPRPPAGVLVHPLSWILGHRLDVLWQHDNPPPGHAALLAAWAAQRAAPLDAVLAPIAQAQLERWSLQQPIYRALRAASLSDDGALLLVRWALQRYSVKWRGEQPWGGLPLLQEAPPPSEVQSALRTQQQAIQTYWNTRITGTPIETTWVNTAIGEMSGLSDAELYALTTMLSKLPSALDDQLFQKIHERFALLPSAQHPLRALAAKIVPPKPPLPDSVWSTEQWLRWATQQYMPFYAWVIHSNLEREHQQACALRYSDWLYTQYPSWLNAESSPLLLCQYQEMSALVGSDERAVVIWLVIDGMTWWQGALMREACERHGLYPKSHRPAVAILPSITSVSKRALVTGQPTIDLAQPTIAEAARVKLTRSAIPAVVSYHLSSAIESLRHKSELRVAVVLFNLIDALAHQSTTFTDNAGIRGYLEDLASTLSNAQQMCVAEGRQLHVLIGSDHGSTLLPSDAPSLPLPNKTREVDDVWEPEISGQEAQKPGTRAVATDLDQFPSIDQQTWYALDRDRFQLDRHYLVPRGYSYIKRRPIGWTHGGLSPEETIVPLLHFTPERPLLRPIEIEFRGTLRAGQAGNIAVVLRNLNSFPVEELMLTVSGATGEATVPHLDALDEHEIDLHFAPTIVVGGELSVKYEVRYNAFGSPQRDVGQGQIALRRLQTDDSSFDDMFS